MNVTGKNCVLRKVLSVVLALAMVLGSMVSGDMYITQAEEAQTHEHSYDENGFCTAEDCEQPYQKPEGDGTAESPYLIGNGG